MGSGPDGRDRQPMTTNQHWRSTTVLRDALVWLLGADIVATVALALALLHQSQALHDYHRSRISLAAAQSATRLFGNVVISTIGLLVATTVVFIVWMWRGTKNNELLGRVRPRYSPGWSIGGWFIPFACLVIPVRIMQDLWHGSDTAPRQDDRYGGRGTSLIGWWWGLFLASRILLFTPVGLVCSVPAAVLAIRLVRAVTSRQEVARTAPRPAPEAGWYEDPTSRCDHRYWDGRAWTEHGSRGGAVVTDPVA